MPNSFVEKKIENLNFETELEKKRKAIESFINEIELEMNNLADSITGIKKEIYNKNMMIDFYISLDSVENEKSSLSPNKRKKLSDDKIIMMRKISLSRDKELDSIKEYLIEKNKLKNNMLAEYNELSKKLLVKKQELKLVKSQLVNHYHFLLSEGIDTR